MIATARPIIVWQMALFYMSSGFWKLTTAFLDPTSSCATVFFCDLLGQYLPQALVTPTLLWAITHAAPVLTVTLELSLGVLAIPLLPRFARRIGLGLLVLFHLMIALTPHPNDIATYGLSNAPRFLFLLPDASATAFDELTNREPTNRLLPAAVVAAAITTAMNTPRGATVDLNVGGCKQ